METKTCNFTNLTTANLDIEKLKKYSNKLGHYARNLSKKGKNGKAYKMQKNQASINASIEQVKRG